MTIREAADKYGTKEYVTSVGDTITKLVDKIYQSRDDVYYLILITLNNRFDWSEIEPNASITYIPKSFCSEIYEITG